MDQRQTCQICEAHLPEKPAAKNSVKCPECGYVNLLVIKKEKTLSDQLAEITIDLAPGNIEATFSTISECFGLDKLENDDIGATIKTSSDRVIQYVSQIKRKSVGSIDKEAGHLDYKLIKKIGQGGMGIVYMARQSSLNREVALKMTKEDRQMTDGMIEHFGNSSDKVNILGHILVEKKQKFFMVIFGVVYYIKRKLKTGH